MNKPHLASLVLTASLLLLLTSCMRGEGVKPLMAGVVSDSAATVPTATESAATESAAAVTADDTADAADAVSLLFVDVPADVPQQTMSRTAYIVSYNAQTRLPNYVAWHLTAAHTNGAVKRTDDFREDEQVKGRRATLADYYNHGYDRGHMCPAGDNKWSTVAMSESFLLTNMCPQVPALNSGDWRELEELCRKWAKRYGDIYIVCGPVLYGSQHTTIGRNKVVVPEAFFKVVLRLADDYCEAIGFVYDNAESNKSIVSYARSVDDIERLTGFDFFAALPDDMETSAEAIYSLSRW